VFLVVGRPQAKAIKYYSNSTTAYFPDPDLTISAFQTYLWFSSLFLSCNKSCKGMVSGKRGSSISSVIAYSSGISQIHKVLPLLLKHISFTTET